MVSHETKITPTEVAYYFIQRFRNFDERLQQWQQALAQYARNLLKDERMRLLQVESRRQQLAQMVLVNKRRDVENLQQLLPLLSRQLLNREKEKVARMENSVALLHPRNILKRGFSVTLLNGKPVTKATELKAGDELVTQLHEGEVKSRVE